MGRTRRALAIAALSVLPMLAGVLPASAGERVTTVTVPAEQNAGALDGAGTQWFGNTYIWSTGPTHFSGWVDGNGPDSYRFRALCYSGNTAYGATRWAGDRRGSDAYCGTGVRYRYIDYFYA